jgi:hypothetical protein
VAETIAQGNELEITLLESIAIQVQAVSFGWYVAST